MHEFAPCSSHKANDDVPYSCETLELRYNPFICFGNSKNIMVELWWEEVCFAVKADAQQIRREGNNAKIIFFKERSGVFRSSYRI
jgi:hypothetical protein